MANKLTHLDEQGQAIMVDISDKGVTTRVAIASARLTTEAEVLALLERAANKKGDVFATARVAGIMAAKRTSDLIPLCHPLALTKATIEFQVDATTNAIDVTATCAVEGKTGVEMEALTAASVAALTLYDMCKAVDPEMVIGDIKLLQKTGGKRGVWQREGAEYD
ncbi:cyclic pyranopterin monophosphate synthase MoaC [Aliidiomarina halalkaliphila]|uniref:Cyclic pyranopterin monophosphate synthase n=1 Tax=Aliidiomarina halalkaliphila TaxID=2593535 RepID=A0A552X3T5_9GAMM|nr:cyclic pyranopterin monophosphate synthase MoaC [Aliidiomarina halalkaliphila]TRW49626.1 cyclic pyranopterin monophosphate synthase MoaC [Aliidiomarina halalkaliphila]